MQTLGMSATQLNIITAPMISKFPKVSLKNNPPNMAEKTASDKKVKLTIWGGKPFCA